MSFMGTVFWEINYSYSYSINVAETKINKNDLSSCVLDFFQCCLFL